VPIDEHLLQSQKYHLSIKQALVFSFKLLNSQLIHEDFETLLSGSTLTAILILGDFIYSANVGDSKSILVKKKKKSSSYNFGSFEGDPFQLTVDHRPNDYLEKQRIEKNGGVVK